jgi:two-component system, LuxR family, sensor kinase FixL
MHQPLAEIILNSILDGVLIVDKDGRIIYANKAAEGLFSQTAGQLTGEYFGFPVSPFDVQEIELFRNRQVLTVQMLATKIQWAEKNACLLSIRDITELKKATRELEQQKLHLEELNEELEQYASLASHDLKEPVRKIMLYSERLLNNLERQSVETTKAELSKILGSAVRMKALISGIADFARAGNKTIQYERVNLNEVLKDVLTDLELTIAEKQAKITHEDLPTIDAIKIQMHQLFLNIISNALKYSKDHESPVIRIEKEETPDHVRIRISDNGVGFENSLAEKVFQPFQRLKSANTEGSGIGLTICKKIVQAHGGKISVESVPGDGSQFIFTLARSA